MARNSTRLLRHGSPRSILSFLPLMRMYPPRELIVSLAEDILAEFEHLTLIDKYDVYQVLLAYWNEVMNDDVSLIISEPGWLCQCRATDNIEEETRRARIKAR